MVLKLNEVWKAIPGYEGVYEVSNIGRIKSLPRNGTKNTPTIRKTPIGCFTGYPMVILRRNNHQKGFNVHTLVMLAFCGPCPDGMEVCHNNNDRTDSRLTNLRYDTRSNNHKDKIKHGTWQGGEANPAAKLTWHDVSVIRNRAVYESHRAIAKDYGVTDVAIGYVINEKTWVKKLV